MTPPILSIPHIIRRMLPLFAGIALANSAHAQSPLTSGGNHSGTIAVIGDSDTWSIDATAGTTIRIQAAVLSGTDFEPYIRLYAPGGGLVSSSYSSSSTALAYSAAASGTYTLEILDASTTPNGTGSYMIHAALSKGPFVVPSGDEGGALSSGEYYDGTIDLADMDLYSISASAGETLRIAMADTGGTSLSPYLLLYGPDGSLLTSSYSANSCTIVHQAAVAGNYTVVAMDGNSNVTGSGNYRLYFSQLTRFFTVPSSDEGGALSSGEHYDGTIDLADMDLYSISASAGETLRISMAETGGTSLSPYLLLYGPDGSLLTSSYSANSCSITHQATVAGNYTVVAMDGNSNVTGSGNYRLYFSQLTRFFTVPSSDEGGALSSGEYYDGTIDLADMDLYSISASAGETLRIAMAETGGTSLSPYLLLYGPDGSLLTSSYSANSCSIVHQATVAGNYTVVAMDGNSNVTGSGNYRLYFSQLSRSFTVPSGDEGGALSSGEYYDGTIDLADMDLYSISASAGETLRIAMAETGGTSLSPYLLLYGPDGSLLTSSYSANSCSIVHQAAVAGIYSVVAMDGNSNVTGSGNYRLYFSQLSSPFTVPAGDEGSASIGSGAYSGTIDLADMDLYSFAADFGDSMSVSVEDTSVNSFQPLVLLYGPDGSLVTSDSGSVLAQVSSAINVSGTYMLVVQDYNTNVSGSGNYTMNFSLTPGGTSVPGGPVIGSLGNGGASDGSIETLGDLDKWEFQGTAGEEIHLQVGRLTMGSFNTALHVYDPSGQLVGNASGAYSSLKFIAPQSGTYTVAVQEAQGNDTGDYRLFLARSANVYTVPSGDDGGSISSGSNHVANITFGDLDLWNFDALAGEAIRVQAGNLTGGSFGLDIIVYAPDGKRVVSDSSSSVSVGFTAPQSGSYKVLVRENESNATGSYRLHFARVPTSYIVPGGDDGGTVTSGSNHEASITIGDIDLWDFTALAGDSIHLQAGNLTGGGFQLHIAVFGPDGKPVASDLAGSVSVRFTAPLDGLYTVMVSEGQTNDSGSYRLHFARIPSSFSIPSGDDGGDLTNGATHAGAITLGDLDLWSFDALAGEPIHVQAGNLTGGSFTLNLLVYAPDGRSVVSGSAGNVPLVFVAPTAGTYTVLVREGNTNDSGSYQLHFARVPQRYFTSSGDEGGGVENGGMPGGSLSIGDLDIWSFHAVTGDEIVLDLSRITTGTFLPVATVYDPDGNPVVRGSGTAFVFEFTALKSGTYTVVIRESGANDIGDYVLTASGMTPLPIATSVSNGSPGSLILSWPSPSTGWIVQESTTLMTGSWSPSEIIPVDNGFEKTISVDTSSPPKRFFRLMKP